MSSLLSYTATVFIGFFAMMNPIANVPIFMSITGDMRPRLRRSIAMRSTGLAFVIVSAFCLLGKFIFDMFGISLPAFRITGGILIFLIGKEMLSGHNSKVNVPTREDNKKSLDAKLSVAISPLATPILGGPGTIATAMNFTANRCIIEVIACIGAFAFLCGITYFLFLSGEKIIEFIGESAIKVVSRMMGLILAVMGVQMLIHGINGAMKLQF